MGHLRNQTLEKFKDAFEKALKGGEGFSAAANSCRQSSINLFDEGCAGNPLHYQQSPDTYRSILPRFFKQDSFYQINK